MQREVLTASSQLAVIYCAGMTYVGLGATFAGSGGSLAFKGSTDGLNFNIPIDMIPYPTGVGVSSITSSGNYYINVGNIVAMKLIFTPTSSGTCQVYLSATIDQAYADAFIAQNTKYNVSAANSGTNTLTQTAVASHAWKLTGCTISFASPGLTGGVAKATVYDGTVAGNILYQEYIQTPAVAGSVGWSQVLNLPKNSNGNQEITGTPGNAMTIVVSGVNGSTIINTSFESN